MAVSIPAHRVLRLVFLVVGGIVFTLIALLLSSASSMTVAAHEATAAVSAQAYMKACPQPPQGVDLMSLSDAQLQTYDLPSHAVLNENLTHWDTVLAHAKHRMCGEAHTSKHHGSMPSCPQPGSICYTGNWAGNETNESPVVRGLYHQAEIVYDVPTIQTYDSNAQVSYWAGVGGDSAYVTTPAVLVQDGVDSYVSNGVQHNFAWWEVVPGFGVAQAVPLTVNTGNLIDAYTSSNLNNDGYDYFGIWNDSSSTYYACYLNTTGGTSNNDCLPPGSSGNSAWNSDSASGECIVERPTLSGGPAPLAQFQNAGDPANTMTVYDCWSNGQAIGAMNHHDDTMVNSGGTILAKPGAIYNGGLSFPVTWYRET